MLFNEPKLLKYASLLSTALINQGVSVLFNEPKLLKFLYFYRGTPVGLAVSVLFNEPKLLKISVVQNVISTTKVSVLFNEPKLLKAATFRRVLRSARSRFSALQRAEIAEMSISFADYLDLL